MEFFAYLYLQVTFPFMIGYLWLVFSNQKSIKNQAPKFLGSTIIPYWWFFLDLPWRSYELTLVRSFVRPSVRASVTSFSRDWLISFSDFWHKDAKWQCPKCDGARFPEKIHFRPKMPEICRKNRFFGTFSRFHH